jgi:hypothetical protein
VVIEKMAIRVRGVRLGARGTGPWMEGQSRVGGIVNSLHSKMRAGARPVRAYDLQGML